MKATLPLQTLMRTPYNDVAIGRLLVGEPLITWDGRITKIVLVSDISVQDVYRVVFHNGDYLDCSLDQYLTIVTPYSSKFDTSEINLEEAQYWTMKIYGCTVPVQWILDKIYKRYTIHIPKIRDGVSEGSRWLTIVDVIPQHTKKEMVSVKTDNKNDLLIANNIVVSTGID